MSCDKCLSLEFSYNSAKKELEEEIKSLQKKIKEQSDYDNKIIEELEEKNSKILCFINLLDQYPMFWGKSYKKTIKQFLKDNE